LATGAANPHQPRAGEAEGRRAPCARRRETGGVDWHTCPRSTMGHARHIPITHQVRDAHTCGETTGEAQRMKHTRIWQRRAKGAHHHRPQLQMRHDHHHRREPRVLRRGDVSAAVGGMPITKTWCGDKDKARTPVSVGQALAQYTRDTRGRAESLYHAEKHKIKHGTSGARHTRRGARGTLGKESSGSGNPTPPTRRRGRGQTGAVREETGDG
jgi:hypothetical protein